MLDSGDFGPVNEWLQLLPRFATCNPERQSVHVNIATIRTAGSKVLLRRTCDMDFDDIVSFRTRIRHLRIIA